MSFPCSGTGMRRMPFQKAAYWKPKGGLSGCKRRPFRSQKGTFWFVREIPLRCYTPSSFSWYSKSTVTKNNCFAYSFQRLAFRLAASLCLPPASCRAVMAYIGGYAAVSRDGCRCPCGEQDASFALHMLASCDKKGSFILPWKTFMLPLPAICRLQIKGWLNIEAWD